MFIPKRPAHFNLTTTQVARYLAAAIILMVAVVALPIEVARSASPGEVEVQSAVLRLLDEAIVPAQEAGLLLSLKVREGDDVGRGDLIGTIDDRAGRLAIEATQIELEVARATAANDVKRKFAAKSLEVAQAELQRSSDSVRRFPKSVSQSQLDIERLTVERTQLEFEQAEHEEELEAFEVKIKEQALAAAKLQVSRRRIVAPFSGRIVETHIRAGEWVEAGQPTVRMIGIDRLKAEGFVPIDQLHDGMQGASIRLSPVSEKRGASVDRSAQGTVVFVSPEVDPITGQVRIWAEVDNTSHRLRPGQRVQMWIPGDRGEQDSLADSQ